MSVTRQLLTFFAIAFAFTWAVSAWMIIWHIRIEYSILASCGPTIAALITSRLAEGHFRAFRFNVSWRRTLGASALGVGLVLASEIIFPAVATVDAGRLHWSAFASVSAYNYSTLLGGPLTEEPGWRGFALPRLESRFHPLVASLILGTVWATWHLPFFLYPGWNDCPIGIYFMILTGLSVLLTFATNLAQFGVIAPILMHAANNTSGKYFQLLFAEASPGTGGLLNDIVRVIATRTGWSGNLSISFPMLIAIGAWIAALLIVLLTKGRLGYSTETDEAVWF